MRFTAQIFGCLGLVSATFKGRLIYTVKLTDKSLARAECYTYACKDVFNAAASPVISTEEIGDCTASLGDGCLITGYVDAVFSSPWLCIGSSINKTWAIGDLRLSELLNNVGPTLGTPIGKILTNFYITSPPSSTISASLQPLGRATIGDNCSISTNIEQDKDDDAEVNKGAEINKGASPAALAALAAPAASPAALSGDSLPMRRFVTVPVHVTSLRYIFSSEVLGPLTKPYFTIQILGETTLDFTGNFSVSYQLPFSFDSPSRVDSPPLIDSTSLSLINFEPLELNHLSFISDRSGSGSGGLAICYIEACKFRDEGFDWNDINKCLELAPSMCRYHGYARSHQILKLITLTPFNCNERNSSYNFDWPETLLEAKEETGDQLRAGGAMSGEYYIIHNDDDPIATFPPSTIPIRDPIVEYRLLIDQVIVRMKATPRVSCEMSLFSMKRASCNDEDIDVSDKAIPLQGSIENPRFSTNRDYVFTNITLKGQHVYGLHIMKLLSDCGTAIESIQLINTSIHFIMDAVPKVESQSATSVLYHLSIIYCITFIFLIFNEG